jgi:uncharacterized protein YndB with AHSA1/START domain
MKTTDANDTFLVTTPSDREIVMTRRLNAPRALAFDAFTKPELIRRWLLGPDGWSMPVCDVDLKAGGTLRYRWRNDADGTEFGIEGTYREVAAPERIVHVEAMDGFPGEAVVTTTFEERDGATTVTVTCLYESRAIRDIAVESGMATGVATSFDRLADVLAA